MWNDETPASSEYNQYAELWSFHYTPGNPGREKLPEFCLQVMFIASTPLSCIHCILEPYIMGWGVGGNCPIFAANKQTQILHIRGSSIMWQSSHLM